MWLEAPQCWNPLIGPVLLLPGRHPGSTLQTLCVYGKNRPPGSKAPATVYALGSHGHARNLSHPASVRVWVRGSSRLDLLESVALSVALIYDSSMGRPGSVQNVSHAKDLKVLVRPSPAFHFLRSLARPADCLCVFMRVYASLSLLISEDKQESLRGDRRAEAPGLHPPGFVLCGPRPQWTPSPV